MDLLATWLTNHHALHPKPHAIHVEKWDILPKFGRSGQKEVREALINELTVLYMDNAVQDKIQCTVHVDADEHSYDVELIVDTGSSVSIRPLSIYQNLFSACELAKPTVTLCTYSKERIPVIGQLHATVTHEGHSAKCSFMVVESGAALLGLNLFVALHMCIEGNKVIPNVNLKGSPDTKPTVPIAMALTAPEAQVQEDGCAEGFVHKIQLKPHAIPVQQKLRRLPFSV